LKVKKGDFKMKIDERIIVVDVETTNSIDDPLCYDVGFAVINPKGEILESHSYVVADIFLDGDLMESAYFKDKMPQYWEDIKNGKRILRRFKTIKSIFADVVKQYGVKIVVAHNARFDNRALNLTQRFLTSSKYRYFFPFGIEIWDSLKMSREVLKNNVKYDNFCYDNNFLTKRGAKRYTAEILYRFLTDDLDFEESHTGLEDVEIEKEIFAFCVAEMPEIDGALWKRDEDK
jgi:DNA polymerase III epsilon subunit-like protein